MIRQKAVLAGSMLALLILVGCGTTGSDIFGGGNPSYPSGSSYPSGNGTSSNSLRGTVDYVDVNNHSILLTNTNGYNSMLSGSGSSGDSVRVYYDTRTAVDWQGRSYRPEDLERGDQVDVRVSQSGNRLVADALTVTYNANANNNNNSGNYPNGNYPNGNYPNGNYPNGSNPNSNGTYGNSYTIRGTVRSVDSSRGEIVLEQVSRTNFNQDNGSSGVVVVRYDSGLRVNVQGQMSPVSGLERGDVVDVQVENTGGSSYLARKISLVRDIRR